MPKFSQFFGLGKKQPELDFVDIPLETDIPLFLDPFAISQRVDPWGREAHATLVDFFQRVIMAIKRGRATEAQALLSHLGEPNETHLGLSKGRPRGAGLGRVQAKLLFNALKDSSAVKTGLLTALEECELMIDGVSSDKLSDLTTNVLRGNLIEYTHGQCKLHGVTMEQVAAPPLYDPEQGLWRSNYTNLPVDDQGHPIMLVPKSVVRYSPAYDHQTFYNTFAVEYLRKEHIEANSALVQTLKNGNRRVTKKDIGRILKCTRSSISEFIKKNPNTLSEYRQQLTAIEKRKPYEIVDEGEVVVLAGALAEALKSLPPGQEHASDYHSLMVGLLELLFFPALTNPKKEDEIHQGRKRIDISMENAAKSGIFWRLQEHHKIHCPFVFIECKNYREKVSNPEIDQLSGRFSLTRGKVGLLCCRAFGNQSLLIERCKDTFRDGRGLIVPLDDRRIFQLLDLIRRGRRADAAVEFSEMATEILKS